MTACNDFGMTTTKTTQTGTAALKNTASGIEVLFNGHTLDVIKDGFTLIKRAEKVLRSAHIYRTAGYDFDGVNMVAPATQVVQ